MRPLAANCLKDRVGTQTLLSFLSVLPYFVLNGIKMVCSGAVKIKCPKDLCGNLVIQGIFSYYNVNTLNSCVSTFHPQPGYGVNYFRM